MTNQIQELRSLYRITLKNTTRAYNQFFNSLYINSTSENEYTGTFDGQESYIVEIKLHPTDLGRFEHFKTVWSIEVIEEEETNTENAEAALKSLMAFQTHRLNASGKEREIIIDAMIKAKIDPSQLTILISELQKTLK